jgi:tetratricopeptide (TPR) repeat protein
MKTKNLIKIAVIIALCMHGCKDSKDYRDYYNRGIARLEKSKHDLAISDFTKAIEMRPGFAMAHFYRGRTHFRKGEHDQAISDLNKAIELDPRLAVAYGERAVIYFIRKEYDKVWENLHKQESLGLQTRPEFLKALREASGRRK